MNYIHGFHASSASDGFGSTGAQVMLDEGRPGWICFTEIAGLGHADYCDYTDLGFNVIVRLNHGYYPGGTIPTPDQYDAFAGRCADFARTACGCNIWIVGNEPNKSSERPNGQEITPELYADCYARCRDAIHAVSPTAQVAIAAVGPWNVESGDWLVYFEKVLSEAVARGGVDAIALHTYTHGSDPGLVTSTETMATMPGRYYHFLAYRQFMERVPASLKKVPVYITEANQNDPWLDQNNGWVQAAYAEIDGWNQSNEQQIRALCLYRWTHDQWRIDGKTGVIDGFRDALKKGYTWDDKGDGNVATWQKRLEEDCESGHFPAQDGNQHFQVVSGFGLHYRHKGEGDFPAPELKPKDKSAGQPEVFEGNYSQSGFYISATGQFALVSDRIYIEAGKPVRGSAMYMHVFGAQGGGGSRCGIVDGDGPFPDTANPEWPKDGVDPFSDAAITWGEWESTYGGVPNNQWIKLLAPAFTPQHDYVRLIVQFNADTAASGSNGHWDLFTLEQQTDDVIPPVPDDDLAKEVIAIAADLEAMSSDLTGLVTRLYAVAAQIENGGDCPARVTELANEIHVRSTELVTLV